MDKEHLISEILLLPQAAMEYHLSKHLAELFPKRTLPLLYDALDL